MCPGGVVVPCADAPDGLFTNGMSYSNRAGAFANSAVVVPVTPEELADPAFNRLAAARPTPGRPLGGGPLQPCINPLAGFEFIRDLEVRAFALGGGDFVFPAQTIRAYMEGRTDDGPLPKTSFPKPLRWADFRRLFPPKLALALQESFRNFDGRCPDSSTRASSSAPSPARPRRCASCGTRAAWNRRPPPACSRSGRGPGTAAASSPPAPTACAWRTAGRHGKASPSERGDTAAGGSAETSAVP